jgi:hypothetical protein
MTNIEAGFLYDQLNDYNHIIELKKKKNIELILNDVLNYAGFIYIQFQGLQ